MSDVVNRLMPVWAKRLLVGATALATLGGLGYGLKVWWWDKRDEKAKESPAKEDAPTASTEAKDGKANTLTVVKNKLGNFKQIPVKTQRTVGTIVTVLDKYKDVQVKDVVMAYEDKASNDARDVTTQLKDVADHTAEQVVNFKARSAAIF